MSLIDVSICILVVIAGYNLKWLFPTLDRSDKRLLDLVWSFHLLVAIAFHFYIENFGGDAINYWGFPKEMTLDEILVYLGGRTASATLFLINYFPSNVLDLEFLTGNMMYALFGYLGFIFLLLVLKELFHPMVSLKRLKLFGVSIFPLFFFLPNFHFWSGGIGKDAIMFTCILGFLWAIRQWNLRWRTLMWTALLIIFIRPHMLLFLLASFGVGLLFDRQMKAYQKVLIFGLFAVGFVAMFGYVMSFVQLESLESSAISQYADTKASSLNKAQSGSGVDISGYPLPLKIFTFVYRPLFFDINGPLAVLASFENAILLLFSIQILRSKPIRYLRQAGYWLKGVFIFFILSAIAFSLILGNLGIMLRQKNMIMPCLFIFGLYILMEHVKTKHQRS